MTDGPVIVGVDNSDDARAALAWAVDYCAAVNARLIGVHALGLLERDPGGDVVPSQPHRREIAEWMAKRVREACAGRCEARASLRDGSPVEALLGEAERLDASLIVVGTRGEGPSGLALGSTSAELVACSSCAVVVVPRSW